MNNEEFIKVLAEATKTKIPPSIKSPASLQDAFEKQFSYNKIPQAENKTSQAEVADKLIALDFRTVSTPPFEEWITDSRDFRKGTYRKNDIEYNCFDFDWRLVNNRLFTTIKINIWDNHDCAHDVFRSYTTEIAPSVSSLQLSHVCKPCKKNIGTICARTAISTFFVYKNVFVKVRTIPILPESNPLRDILNELTDEALIPKSPNGDPWDMLIAEWIYDILKTTSRFKVFPAEPSPR